MLESRIFFEIHYEKKDIVDIEQLKESIAVGIYFSLLSIKISFSINRDPKFHGKASLSIREDRRRQTVSPSVLQV